MMSDLVTMEFTDEKGETRKLTDLEACQYIALLAAAGNDTTALFSGWAASTLARFPDQRAKLVERPDLIPNAVEEILRFEPPSMCLARVVTKDVVWYDQVVPEGAVMVPIDASAGRDQRHFSDPDPDTLDVERKIDRSMSFGFGVHVCLGCTPRPARGPDHARGVPPSVPRVGRRVGRGRHHPHRQRPPRLLEVARHLRLRSGP